jgi:hypothetical protein
VGHRDTVFVREHRQHDSSAQRVPAARYEVLPHFDALAGAKFSFKPSFGIPRTGGLR